MVVVDSDDDATTLIFGASKPAAFIVTSGRHIVYEVFGGKDKVTIGQVVDAVLNIYSVDEEPWLSDCVVWHHQQAVAVIRALPFDGRRVLTTASLIQAIGRTGKLRTPTMPEDGSSFKAPPFLLADNLKPFVDEHLDAPAAMPITFRSSRGTVGYGYEARLLPVVCRIYLDARRAKVLFRQQKHIAEACEILLSALANVGIDALVDEATGYQYIRTRDALQKLLEQYVSRELARRERTFEPDFYRHMYRLKQWPFNPMSSKRTPQVARLTVDLIYARIHPELLKELKQVRDECNRPNTKLHQWLTTGPNGGHPRLKQHLEGVIALMSVATSWDQLADWMDRRYPKLNETMRLPFPEPDEDVDEDRFEDKP